MMPTTDIDLTLYFRKKHTPPPSVLLVTIPHDNSTKDKKSHHSPFIELRSRQRKKRQPPTHIVGLHVNNSDIHDLSLSSYDWHRHSDKIAQLAPAPDVAYRNTYMEESRREKLATTNNDHRSSSSNSRSPSPLSPHSQQQLPRLKTASTSSLNTSDLLQRKHHPQYRTIYDYIRQSIKQIEHQRNLKQHNFSTRIKRPQNDDIVLRRVLGEKKYSATSKTSSISKNDLRNSQSFVNYITHSREQIHVLHTTTPNQSYQQQVNHKYNQQRTNLSQKHDDSPDKRQSVIMVTAAVCNS